MAFRYISFVMIKHTELDFELLKLETVYRIEGISNSFLSLPVNINNLWDKSLVTRDVFYLILSNYSDRILKDGS
jgi:hypothetical protein